MISQNRFNEVYSVHFYENSNQNRGQVTKVKKQLAIK